MAIKAKPKLKFVVLFHVTYAGQPLFSSISGDDWRIKWPGTKNCFLSKALTARDELAPILEARGVSRETKGLTPLLVHVEAHNFIQANELAGETIDVVRGLINFIINSNRKMNPFAHMGLG